MRVVDNAATTVEFSSIKIGECFIWDNCLFIKINPFKEKNHDTLSNAFCFVDNMVTCVPHDCNVVPVIADIVIRSKGVQG